MTPAIPARRRAEQFDSLVDALVSPALGTVPATGELADLARFATALASAPAIEPRAEFSASLRERLMSAAAAELPELTRGTVPSRGTAGSSDRLAVRTTGTRRRDRRLSVAIGAVAIVGATGGMAFASQGALPGDTLYPVKRAIEDVRTTVALDDDAKGAVLLHQADQRLDEATSLSGRGDGSGEAGDISAALDSFTEQAKQASDLLLAHYRADGDTEAVEELRSFAADSITTLTELEALLPDEARGSLLRAAQTLFAIDADAAQVCPDCDGTGITELPSSLLALLSDTTADGFEVINPTPSAGPSTGAAARPGSGAGAPSTRAPGGDRTSAAPQPEASSNPGGGVPSRNTPSLPVSPKPSPTSLGDAVGGAGSGLDGTLDGVGDAVGDNPLGNTVDGLGDVVSGVTDGIGSTLDGLTGGLAGDGRATK